MDDVQPSEGESNAQGGGSSAEIPDFPGPRCIACERADPSIADMHFPIVIDFVIHLPGHVIIPFPGDSSGVGVDRVPRPGTYIDSDGDGRFDMFRDENFLILDEDEDGSADTGIYTGDGFDAFMDFGRRRIAIDLGQNGGINVDANEEGDGWSVCVDLDEDGHCDVRAVLGPHGEVRDKVLDVVDLANSLDPSVIPHLADENYMEGYVGEHFRDVVDAVREMQDELDEAPEFPSLGIGDLNSLLDGFGDFMGSQLGGVLGAAEEHQERLDRCEATARAFLDRLCENRGDFSDIVSADANQALYAFLDDLRNTQASTVVTSCEYVETSYPAMVEHVTPYVVSVWERITWKTRDGALSATRLKGLTVFCDEDGRIVYAYFA